MKVTEIIINEQPYQLFFGGAALSSIAKEVKKTGLMDILTAKTDKDEQTEIPSTVDNVIKIIDNASIIAFAGIENYCLVHKTKNPFESAEHLKAHVSNFDELAPAITAHTEASMCFFRKTSEDNSEGEDKGATVTAPN